MKKQILKACTFAAFSLFLSNVCFGQAFISPNATTPDDLVTDQYTLNVGIHTNTPQHPLTVNGDMGYEPGPWNRHLYGNTQTVFAMYANTDWADGAGIMMSSAAAGGGMDLVTEGTGPTKAFTFWSNSFADPLMEIQKDAKVYHYGDLLFAPSALNRHFSGNTQTVFALYGNTGWHDGSGIMMSSAAAGGGLDIVAEGTGTAKAVTFWSNSFADPLMEIKKDAKIDFYGDLSFAPSGTNRHFKGSTSTVFALFSANDWNDGSGITMNSASNGGDVNFVSHGTGSGKAFTFWADGWNTDLMAIQKDGKVRIGTDQLDISSGNYKLFVETGIMTERIKVAVMNTTDWADYVFADEYELTPLNEVEAFVKENKHLPNIPSANEVVENGIDLGTMDAKLLEKIEELTLYVIEQQKQINELKSQLNK